MRNKIKLLLTFSSRSCYTHFSKSLSLDWNLVSFPPCLPTETIVAFVSRLKELEENKKNFVLLFCVCVSWVFSLCFMFINTNFLSTCGVIISEGFSEYRVPPPHYRTRERSMK